MSFFKNFKNLFESTEEKQDRLDRERRQRQANEAAEAEGGIEFTIGMDNYDDHTEADAADAERAAERAAEADAADAERAAERAAEAMTAAQANARRRLSERIERWNERTLENVGDDIKTTFSLTTKADRLGKKALALEKEYNALVADHEKLFANRYRYTDKKGLPSYFYKYPTYQLWAAKPRSEILAVLFDAAANEYKKNGDEIKAKDMEQRRSGYYWAGRWGEYDDGPLPPTAVLCPEPLVSEFQGGGKKSKSKYSRKTRTKYSRKSRTKYSRKSRSRYSRKY